MALTLLLLTSLFHFSTPYPSYLWLGGSRSYQLQIPANYTPSTPSPLLILLHGYQNTPQSIEAYFKTAPLADKYGYLYAVPGGLSDVNGDRFWNGTEACCDFYGPPVDDAAYLVSMLDEIEGKFNVDKSRVYLGGHSNGVFLSFNVACHFSERIAAIFGIAGMMYKDKDKCKPNTPVSLLHIHGTKDVINVYNGGVNLLIPYASENETMSYWAAYNRCSQTFAEGTPFKLISNLPGDNTLPLIAQGCPEGVDTILWKIENGVHSPLLEPDFGERVFAFLGQHKKVMNP